MTKQFCEGETVLFVDSKKRSNLVLLSKGATQHTHTGYINHDDVIGRDEPLQIRTTGDARYLVLRPTLSEYMLKMKRGAQVIYPKDIGPILMIADIHEDAKVLESGIGSGALSLGMLRAGASITGYELREDFASIAIKNVTEYLGTDILSRYSVEIRDIYEGIEGSDFDRIVLDLPEPWRVVPHAIKALRSGGIFVSYLPSIHQVSLLHEALDEFGFEMAKTIEVLERGWHVKGRAIRPDHRMVAHTGFLTSARLMKVESESEVPGKPLVDNSVQVNVDSDGNHGQH